jgi:hypothetical protein
MEEINLLLDDGLSARDKRNMDYFTENAKTEIRDAMDKLLDDLSKLGTTFTHSVTWGVTDEGLKKKGVIIIYFRANPEASHTKNIVGAPSPPGNAAGWTVIGAKATISEAYVEMNMPTSKLARIAIHEMMHNKCQMDNDALHDSKKGGGGIANSPTIGSESVTPENAKLVGKSLTKSITQWRPGGSLN